MKISEMLYGSVQVSSGSVKIPVGGLIAEYRKKYDASNVQAMIKCSLYFVNSSRRMAHFKVPSSSMLKSGAEFYYDVVFEFMTLDAGNIENSDIRLFTNSPGFVYRSAYALHYFGSGGLNRQVARNASDSQLIPELRVKYPPIVFNEPPSKTNPGELAISDASVYYALFYLIDNISPNDITTKASSVSISRVVSAVATTDRIETERKKLSNKLRKAKAKERNETKKDFNAREKGLDADNGMMRPAGLKRAKSVAGGVKSTAKTKGANRLKSPRRLPKQPK